MQLCKNSSPRILSFSPTSASGNSYMCAFKSTITLVMYKKKRILEIDIHQIRDQSVECRGITFARVELEIQSVEIFESNKNRNCFSSKMLVFSAIRELQIVFCSLVFQPKKMHPKWQLCKDRLALEATTTQVLGSVWHMYSSQVVDFGNSNGFLGDSPNLVLH